MIDLVNADEHMILSTRARDAMGTLDFTTAYVHVQIYSRRFAFTARLFQFSPDEAKTAPRRDKHIPKIMQDPPQA